MKRTEKIATEREKLLAHAVTMDHAEARFLVASYYASQEMRKRLDLQQRHAVGEGVETPIPQALSFTSDRFAEIESDMSAALMAYAKSTPVGRWCLSHTGIGPVITAGLLAHLDITKAPTAGHFWSFAGLNPERKWVAGEKRPYNAALKQVCYHLGECVKRCSGKEDAFYGHIYRERKTFLVERNEAGGNAERAKTFVTKSAEVKKTLAQGKLPAGNLDRQACNYVAKMFLSHLHSVMFWDRYRALPPKPFVIEHLGHVHFVRPPNLEEYFPDYAAALNDAEPRLAAA